MIVTLVAGAFALRLDVRIERDETLNPSNPFATTFRVDNQWVLSIYDVSLECHVDHAESELHSGLDDVTLVNFNPVVKEIGAKDSATFDYAALDFPVQNGSAVVTAYYRPSFWPAHVTKKVRFTIVSDSEHKPHWLHGSR